MMQNVTILNIKWMNESNAISDSDIRDWSWGMVHFCLIPSNGVFISVLDVVIDSAVGRSKLYLFLSIFFKSSNQFKRNSF